MKRRMMVAAAAGMILVGVVFGAAQATSPDIGHWSAKTDRTRDMTGDLTITPGMLTIYQSKFPLARVRKLTPAETGAVFDADTNARIGGDLYRLHVPPGVYYTGGDLLCGREVIRWMATYVSGRTLQVAFFSGDDAPVFTFDAVSNSTAMCGMYIFSRD